ncbi:MAG: hypothetical protein JSU63_05045 [Phycisphaerales bacterium]|nr:MAG: hypothetical protein JSU63_05045 [Phycisphaerales bacterium]
MDERRFGEEDLGLSRAEGAGLRAFHQLLKQQDKDGTKTWGGLRRVINPSGDVLWVCPEHYKVYDRGLPTVKTAR